MCHCDCDEGPSQEEIEFQTWMRSLCEIIGHTKDFFCKNCGVMTKSFGPGPRAIIVDLTVPEGY